MRHVYGVRGDDDALDEYLDRIDALEDENDPSASDLGGTRTGADETEPDTHEDAGAITMNSTAEPMTTVLEDPRDLHARAMDGQLVTPLARLERFERAVHVTPNKGVRYTYDDARRDVDLFLSNRELDASSVAIVYLALDLARPAPFDPDAGDPEYLLTSQRVWYESDPETLAAGGGWWERTTNLESPRPDWALSRETEVGGNVQLIAMSETGRQTVELDTVDPDEFRRIAQFFTDAADALQAAQAAVKAAQAEAGVTA